MQKCTSCNHPIGSYRIVEIEAAKAVREYFLCDNCSKFSKPSTEASTANKALSAEMIKNLLGDTQSTDSEADEAGTVAGIGEASCPGCGLTASEFRLRVRLGCPRCYEVFRTALLPLLENIHGATQHLGRRPAVDSGPGGKAGDDASMTAQPPSQSEQLHAELTRAVAEERYEDAARLRDQLDRLDERAADEA